MHDKQPAIYILASARSGTLYVGVTSDLVKRAWQHKTLSPTALLRKQGVDQLAHYEVFGTMEHAIVREKRLKKWNRLWKLRLIEEGNPEWRDLWGKVIGAEGASTGCPPPRA